MFSVWISVLLYGASMAHAAEVIQNSVAFLDPNYQFEQLNEQNVKLVLERRPVHESLSTTTTPTTAVTTIPSEGNVNYDFATTTTLTKFITVEIAPRIDARNDDEASAVGNHYKPAPSALTTVATLTTKIVESPLVTSTEFISTSAKETILIIGSNDANKIEDPHSAIDQKLTNGTSSAIRFEDVRKEQMSSISELLKDVDANKSNTSFYNIENGNNTISSGVSKIELGIGILGFFMAMMIMMT